MRIRLLLVLAACLALSTSAFAASAYVALGDSLPFGYTTPAATVPSFGDQGYVAAFADFLAGENGGVRPDVLNLSIPGETSGSFFTGGSPYLPLSLRYTSPTTTQDALLLSTLAARPVETISVQLGINDLLVTANSPGFLQWTPAQQQAAMAGALDTVQTNYTTLLTQIRAQDPHADLFLLGYYDPLAATPNDPLSPAMAPAVAGLNQIVAGEAQTFDADYVDVDAAFAGHEGDLTYMTALGFPNGIHPNAQGYSVIAHQLSQAAAVPESSPLLLLLLGVSALAAPALRACKRREG